MGKSDSRRDLVAAYKGRKVTGGVCSITNEVTGRVFLLSGVDLRRFENRFRFAQATGSCVIPVLEHDWARHGAGAFAFARLEEVDRKETQSDAEFAADLATLEDLWRERLRSQGVSLY